MASPPDAPIRKIIHVDMDAFFASIEQRDFPELRGKPVAVGGSSDRGVVAAASYEARKFGVHSALSSKVAAQRCPDLIFVKHRFDVYQSVSRQIMEIFRGYTDLVEPLSLDEAFLDVTHNKKGIPSATLIAREIKREIKEQTQLTASAGISVNKFLAKVASDLNKPDGISVITPNMMDAFIDGLEIDTIPGVGKVTAAKMRAKGIFTGADMKRWAEVDLARQFGKAGSHFYRIVHGIDNREVQPNRIRKSQGAERTFSEDIYTEDQMHEALAKIAAEIGRRIEKSDTKGKTVTLKIKFKDFTQTTRSKTFPDWVDTENAIFEIVKRLLIDPTFPPKPVRLLGISLSNLNSEPKLDKTGQLTIQF